MNVIEFENTGTFKTGEVFEWNVPGWILNHRYSTKRSDVFTLSRIPEFRFCLTLRPYTDVSAKSVSFHLKIHRIPPHPNATPDMDVRFILFRSDSVYKWSGTMKVGENELTANFPHVTTYDCLNIQCIVTFSEPPPQAEKNASGLACGMVSLLNSGNFSDITLCADNKEFNVHRCILAARSTVFSAMFSHDLKEKNDGRVEIADISSDVMQQLLQHIYTDEIDELTPQEYLALFSAADKYDLLDLRKKCSRRLQKKLTLDSLVQVLVAADLHQEDELKEAAVKLFLENAVTVMSSEEWLSCLKNHTQFANSILLRLAMK